MPVPAQVPRSEAVPSGGSYFYPALGPGVDSLANPQAGNYCTTLNNRPELVRGDCDAG